MKFILKLLFIKQSIKELQTVQEKAKVYCKDIDSNFALKMKELKQMKVNLSAFHTISNKQLKSLHIEKMTVLKMLEKAVEISLDPNIPLEEKKLAGAMAVELNAQIANFGREASTTLDILAKKIPPVTIPDKFD